MPGEPGRSLPVFSRGSTGKGLRLDELRRDDSFRALDACLYAPAQIQGLAEPRLECKSPEAARLLGLDPKDF